MGGNQSPLTGDLSETNMRNISSEYIPNFFRVDNALQQLGIDTARYYRMLGIQGGGSNQDGQRVSVSSYLDLLNLIAQSEGRPLLGIEIAKTRDVANLGTVGYMMRNSPNFGRCLALVNSYLNLIIPGSKADLVRSEGNCTWVYGVEGYTPEHSRHEIEMTLLQFVNSIRELFSLPDWRPEAVFLQHAAPRESRALQREFGPNILFDHYCNGVMFSEDLLHRTISDADPRLLEILESQVQENMKELKTGNTLPGRITFLISSRLGIADTSASSLAPVLGMSLRTLHRRLRDEGTSLQELRDLVILQLAKKTLCTTAISVTQLAQQLGYSDTSAFDRAFKRLTGLSPQAYRREYSHV